MSSVVLAWVFGILLLLSFVIIGVMVFYLLKFVKIIMVFEDDLGEAINSLKDLEDSVKGVLELELFFDDEKLKIIVSEVMDNINLARFQVNQIIKNFTWRSKQQYIFVVEEEEEKEVMEGEPVQQLTSQSSSPPNREGDRTYGRRSTINNN
jgi:hypothetical protein